MKSSSGGLTTLGLLQVVFIVLKLCKVINWSWWWVLSPLILSASISIIILIIFAISVYKD